MVDACVYSDNTGKGSAAKNKTSSKRSPTKPAAVSGEPEETSNSKAPLRGKREASDTYGYSTSGSEAEKVETPTPAARRAEIPTPDSTHAIHDTSPGHTPKVKHQSASPVIHPAAVAELPSDAAIRQAQINMEHHVRTLDTAVALHHARKLTSVNMTHFKQATMTSGSGSSSGEEWGGDTDQSGGADEHHDMEENARVRQERRMGSGAESDDGTNAGMQELDVALGHLSIQENGRSRYVGGSFWALLSSEVRYFLFYIIKKISV